MTTARTKTDYRKHWRELNADLHEIESRTGDLRAVFAALYAHQLETGFIRDSFESVKRFSFCHPESGSRCLRIQFNPDRAMELAQENDKQHITANQLIESTVNIEQFNYKRS